MFWGFIPASLPLATRLPTLRGAFSKGGDLKLERGNLSGDQPVESLLNRRCHPPRGATLWPRQLLIRDSLLPIPCTPVQVPTQTPQQMIRHAPHNTRVAQRNKAPAKAVDGDETNNVVFFSFKSIRVKTVLPLKKI